MATPIKDKAATIHWPRAISPATYRFEADVDGDRRDTPSIDPRRAGVG